MNNNLPNKPSFVSEMKKVEKMGPNGRLITYYKLYIHPNNKTRVYLVMKAPGVVKIQTTMGKEVIKKEYTYNQLKQIWFHLSHFLYDYDFKLASKFPVFKPGANALTFLDDTSILVDVKNKDMYPYTMMKLSYSGITRECRLRPEYRIQSCVGPFIRELLNAYKLNFHKVDKLHEDINVSVLTNDFTVEYNKKAPYSLIEFTLTQKEGSKAKYSFVIRGMYPRNYLVMVTLNGNQVVRDRLGPDIVLADLCKNLIRTIDNKQKVKQAGNTTLVQKVTQELSAIHSRKVLVLCYPKQIVPSMPHPKQKRWEHILKESHVDNPGYETVDNNQESDSFKPTHRVDPFSKDITDQVKTRYDAVIAVDCKGPWLEIFKKSDKNDQLAAFLEMFKRLFGLVKEGGFLLVSKVFSQMLDKVEPKFTYSEFSTYMKEKGEYTVDIYIQNTESSTPTKTSNLETIPPEVYSSMIKLSKKGAPKEEKKPEPHSQEEKKSSTTSSEEKKKEEPPKKEEKSSSSTEKKPVSSNNKPNKPLMNTKRKNTVSSINESKKEEKKKDSFSNNRPTKKDPRNTRKIDSNN